MSALYRQPQPRLSAQPMVLSPAAMLTPKRTGTLTHTCWVMVTVQLSPDASAVHTTRGAPWQVTDMDPSTAVGVMVSGAVTSTHCVTTLLHPSSGQDVSAWVRDGVSSLIRKTVPSLPDVKSRPSVSGYAHSMPPGMAPCGVFRKYVFSVAPGCVIILLKIREKYKNSARCIPWTKSRSKNSGR